MYCSARNKNISVLIWITKQKRSYEKQLQDCHDFSYKLFYSAEASSVAGASSTAGASSAEGASAGAASAGTGSPSADIASAGTFSESPSFFSSSGLPGTTFGVFLGIPRISSSSSSSFATSKSS